MRRVLNFLIVLALLLLPSCRKKKEGPPDLKVRVSRLAIEIKGIGQYQPRPDNVFKPGDIVWVYSEVEGFWFKKVAEKRYEYWAIATLTLYDEEGNVVHTKEIINQHGYYDQPLPSLFFKTRLVLKPELPEGRYTLVLYFMDGLSKKSTEVEHEIIVKVKKEEKG